MRPDIEYCYKSVKLGLGPKHLERLEFHNCLEMLYLEAKRLQAVNEVLVEQLDRWESRGKPFPPK